MSRNHEEQHDKGCSNNDCVTHYGGSKVFVKPEMNRDCGGYEKHESTPEELISF